MLTRILVQDLTERLPGTLVLAWNGAISDSPTSYTDINIQRLDADSSGTVILLAQIAITGRNAGIRSVRLSRRQIAGNVGSGNRHEHGDRAACRHHRRNAEGAGDCGQA